MREYRICKHCVMDTTDPDISFDADGICNHCSSYYEMIDKVKASEKFNYEKLQEKIDIIKEEGRKNDYDCVLGVSGGTDSTFMAYYAHKLRLRPLIVHFDNGWNSELSVKNIENIINNYNFDLYTYVIDWEEFKNLQRSFFKASVIDIEMITDHAIMATMFNIAKKYNLKYVLSGTNLATEFIMPKSWVYHKWDLKNIKAIQNKFGTKKIKKFPTFSLYNMIWTRFFQKLQYIELLNYIDYKKEDAVRILKNEICWKDYETKHGESIFTRFYQGYILPNKFGVDKRKAHFSNLICSGQMSREEALNELRSPPYNEDRIIEDKEYVLKKLEFSESEFNNIMKQPPKFHIDYPNSTATYNLLIKIRNITR